MKFFYKGIVCFLIFILSICFFGKNMKEKKYNIETVTDVEQSAFPIMYVQSGDYMINPMRGYTSNLNASYVKEGMVPLNSTKTCEFIIDENKKSIKKVNYEIVDVQSNKVVEDGVIRKLNKKGDYKTFKIVIENELEVNKEYAIKNVLITSKGTKINYYLRVKSADKEHISEIINFAYEFHNNTLDKEKSDKVVSYIEPNGTMSSSDLSYVNINSNLKMISFGNMEPKVVSDIYTNVRDVTSDTAMLELVYYIQANTDSGVETYKVCEGYRIRWTATRMYLLYYDRTMESVFDYKLLSLTANEFKLGITRDSDIDISTNKDNSQICFVRDGSLWYYNVKENQITKLYSFRHEEKDYLLNMYDENNIKVINVDDNGNVFFMAYGYMNRGDYEGRTAIILYKYYAEQNRTEEMANIPLEVTYDILEKQLNDFSFVNENEVFFFSVAESIYSYSIPSSTMTTLAQNVAVDDMVISKEGKYIAWQTLDNGYSDISIMKLNNYKQSKIQAQEGKFIKILGTIGPNIIYGHADSNGTATMIDGSSIVPINKVEIADVNGEVVKEYIPENSFVTGAYVEGNKITLDRVTTDASGKYIETETDCIFSNRTDTSSEFGIKSRSTEKTMTDWYLYLPESIKIEKIPKEVKINRTIVKGDTTVKVQDDMMNSKFYYVFAFHGVEEGFDNVANAIAKANERMGSVLDNNGHIIWERGQTASSGEVKDFNGESSSVEDSIYACIHMMLQCAQKESAIDSLKSEKGSYVDILNKYLEGRAIDYSKVPISELVYTISKNRPVMAFMSGNKVVMIIAYDASTITYYDPTTGSNSVVSITDAERIFGEVGSIYISYVD